MLNPTKIGTQAKYASFLIVHFSEHLGEPVKERGKKAHPRAAEHHVMKMPDNQIGVMNLHVDRQGALHQARSALRCRKEK